MRIPIIRYRVLKRRKRAGAIVPLRVDVDGLLGDTGRLAFRSEAAARRVGGSRRASHR
jgi:hypothetical protein